MSSLSPGSLACTSSFLLQLLFWMAWRNLPPAIAQPMRLLQVYLAHNQMKSPREQYAEETPVPCLLPGHVSLLKQ